VAPVAGRVAHVSVAVGETVGEGHALVCVEAMKMEMWLHAQAGGRVSAVHVKVGDQVELNTLLVELELAGSDDNDSNNQET
jgi:geranyl-CoA carboxylase alpha subunit